MEAANDSTNVGLRKVSSGTTTQLRNAAVGQVTTTKQWVRFRVEGSAIKAKVWTDGTQEPSNWEVEATDPSFSEVLQLRWARAATATDAREAYIDDLRVSNLDTNSALPAAPTGLTATAASTSQTDLQWTDNATNESAYTVERSLDGSTGWTELTSTLPQDTTSYSDSGLDAGTTYYSTG